MAEVEYVDRLELLVAEQLGWDWVRLDETGRARDPSRAWSQARLSAIASFYAFLLPEKRQRWSHLDLALKLSLSTTASSYVFRPRGLTFTWWLVS